jgi:hypothetical protein
MMMLIYNNNPNLLVVFEARALRKFKGVDVKIGDTIYGSLMPNNRFYLSKSGVVGSRNLGEVFESNAIEIVDFERI